MFAFFIKRLLFMVPALLLVSIFAFGIMQLQTGDYTTRFALTLGPQGVAALKEKYGLDQAVYVQYFKWIYGIIGRPRVDGEFPFLHVEAMDFGISFQTQQPAIEALFLSANRLQWTLLIVVLTMIFTWLIAIPIGIYSATHKYSVGDHVTTFLGFLGLSIPNFFLALIVLWFLVVVVKVGPNFGLTIGGIIDAKYANASWLDPQKWLNFLWHYWPVLLVVGAANMAQLIRYTRGSLLDVLAQPYVQTARAKGLTERVVIWKHAVRNALNPLISILGFWIPFLFEGMVVAAVVMGLPVVEAGYWDAIRFEDQYILMSGLLFFAFVLFVGNLVADILLMLSDPKIRYE
ncbi:MAG TPA: ABC transporter permease [Candidatus Bipolaricaulota bacterium]